MIGFKTSGSFQKTYSFLKAMSSGKVYRQLHHGGRIGVDALSRSTPQETGETSTSWGYQVEQTAGRVSISWFNTHVDGGVNIAVILQYGHGTGTGGWVEGRDYINPAMRPIFDKILDDVWRQVTNA